MPNLLEISQFFATCECIESGAGLWTLPLTISLRLRWVSVVESSPTSIAVLPPVANTLRLFDRTESECPALASIGDVMSWAVDAMSESGAKVWRAIFVGGHCA